MNCRAEAGEYLFKLGNGCNSAFWRNLRQAWGLRSAPADFGEIRGMIGRDIKNSARNESAGDCREKVVIDHTPRRMPPFWPRIGKQKVESSDRVGGKHFCNRMRNLGREDSCICQPSSLKLPTGTSDSCWLSFDPEKIPVRMSSSDSREKRPFPTTKIDLERRDSTK